jgi:hypothetical protein
MNISFNPGRAASNAFRLTMADSMAERLMVQSELQSGWHTSPSDSGQHLTIKNANGAVTGHISRDGTIKDFNGTLGWL